MSVHEGELEKEDNINNKERKKNLVVFSLGASTVHLDDAGF